MIMINRLLELNLDSHLTFKAVDRNFYIGV